LSRWHNVGDPVKEQKIKNGDVAHLPNIIMEEDLPLKYVFYPDFYGFPFAFQAKRDEPPFFCDCAKESLRMFFQHNFKDFNEADSIQRHNKLLSLRKNLPYKSLIFLNNLNEVLGPNSYKAFTYRENLCHICNKKIPKLQYCNEMYGGKFVRMYGWYIKQIRWEMGLPKFGTDFNKIKKEEYPDDLKEVLEEIPSERKANYWRARQFPFRYDMDEAIKSDKEWGKVKRKLSKYFENLLRAKMGYKKVGEAWVTETSLYYMVKNLYPDLKVIHHYRPKILEGLELDIFIKDKKIGIEYQGIQHFKPVTHWGGKEALRKKELCNKNGIKLVYFNYDENITESLVKSRLEI